MFYSCPQDTINMRTIALLALWFATVAALPSSPQRIVGGYEANLSAYPSIAALLHSREGLFTHTCGGVIINNRSFLTAAQCTYNEIFGALRVRVGSVLVNSGGDVYNVNGNIVHPSFNPSTLEHDLAILRSATTIAFENYVRPAAISDASFGPIDHGFLPVYAFGWGATSENGAHSEKLLGAMLVVIDQSICRNIYDQYTSFTVHENTLCVNFPYDGNVDQCSGDTGGPLFYSNLVVGIFSFNVACGSSFFPSVNTRVNSYVDWIESNA